MISSLHKGARRRERYDAILDLREIGDAELVKLVRVPNERVLRDAELGLDLVDHLLRLRARDETAAHSIEKTEHLLLGFARCDGKINAALDESRGNADEAAGDLNDRRYRLPESGHDEIEHLRHARNRIGRARNGALHVARCE